MILGVAALLVEMVMASAAPAFARGHHDWQPCCAVGHFGGPFGFFNDFGDHNDFERQNTFINCPVVGVIADNGSAINNTCHPLVVANN
jgi:hypothetical protein